MSQWAISIISAILIVLPQIQIQPNGAILNVLQSAIAIVILVYSAILSSENFYHRSKEMYRCALEIETLMNHLDEDNNKINEIKARYTAILSHYDNHEPIDYSIVASREETKEGRFKAASYWIDNKIRIRAKMVISYIYYLPLLIIVGLIAIVIYSNSSKISFSSSGSDPQYRQTEQRE